MELKKRLHRLILMTAVGLMSSPYAVNAQYAESWSSDGYFIGCENTDADAAKEMVFVWYVDSYDNHILVIDGATGNLEWDSGTWDIIIYPDDLTSRSSPRLIDVDGDGTYEILFKGRQLSGDDVKWHLYSYTGGGAGVSGQNNYVPTPQLFQNYPNPFNPQTTIKYSVPEGSDVSLRIYNVNGQLVRTLIQGRQNAGEYQVQWNSRDQQGRTVASGMYFYTIEAGNFTSTKKMITIK